MRDMLYERARGLEPFHVQGHWRERFWEPTLTQLSRLLHRSQAVVFLIGTSEGALVADVPASLRDEAKKLGCRPTFVVCEYLIAKECGTPTCYFELVDADKGARDPGIAAIRRDVERAAGKIVPISVSPDECVPQFLNALRQMLAPFEPV
jgi:hypothetical protein